MIFNVQPQSDGFFCLWYLDDGAEPVRIEYRAEDAAEWRCFEPPARDRAFVPAGGSQERFVLRLAVGAADAVRRSGEVRCRLVRERWRDRLPARVPYTRMRRFHSWRRFAAYVGAGDRGRVGMLAGGEFPARNDMHNGVYVVRGEPTLFSRAIGRELHQHPTHAPAVTRAAARGLLWREPVRLAALGPDEHAPTLLPAAAGHVPEVFQAVVPGGIRSRIVRLRATRPHGGTAIYHEGHTGSGLDSGWDTVSWLLARGWDVCCIDMLLCGMNLVDRRPRLQSHNDLLLLDAADALAPLAAMVAPMRALVDQLESEGRAAPVIFGRSGGGFMAYLYAALDVRVAACVSLAGGVPLSQRLELAATDLGDYEQFAPAFFDRLRHEDLMVAAGERALLLLYNTHDSDCFALPARHPLAGYLAAEAARHACRVRVSIDPRHRGHSFGPDAYREVAVFLGPLEREGG